MYQMPKYIRMMRLLAAPLILVAVGIGVFYAQLSFAVLALVIAAFPSMYAVDIPWGRGPVLHSLRSTLILLSTVAIDSIIWAQHSVLPGWLVIVAAIYAAWCLIAATLDFVPVLKPELRQKVYERRVRRGWPTSRL